MITSLPQQRVTLPEAVHTVAAESTMFNAIYHQVRIEDNIAEATVLNRESNALFIEAQQRAWRAEREFPQAAEALRAIRALIASGMERDAQQDDLCLTKQLKHTEATKCACRERIQLDELVLRRYSRAQEIEHHLIGRDEAGD